MKDDAESLRKMAEMIAAGDSESAWNAALEVAKTLPDEQSVEATRKRLHRKFKKDEARLMESAGDEPKLWNVVYEAMREVPVEERPEKIAEMIEDDRRRRAAIKKTYDLVAGGRSWRIPDIDPEHATAILAGVIAPEDKLPPGKLAMKKLGKIVPKK